MTEGKYSSQQNHLRKNYVRFSLDFKPDVLEQFKNVCKKNNTKPTTEIKKFIAEYIKKAEEWPLLFVIL